LCYSRLPFRTGFARPLRRGFSRGFGGVPKGFSGIKHRYNERELAAMRLTIERAALLRALGHVQSVVERRNTIPILSNVLLRAEGGQLSLSATDMDLEIVASVAAQGTRKGAATAPAHTLYDIVRKLREGAQIEIESAGDKGSMTVRSGRSTFTLACLPPEDYPLMAGGELAHGFTLSATDLKRLIDRTRFAISTEETRYYLNGIFLHAAKSSDLNMLRAVATDGHRLARMEIPLPEGAAGMPGVIVPRKTVTELRKLIDELDQDVAVALSDTKIRFTFGNAVLTSKLIDGTFPDYDRVIPAGNEKILEVVCKDFAEAVDRVSTISTEKSRAVKLTIERGTLMLSATSPENGTATEEIEVRYSASPLEIGFNSRYLLDITEQIEGEGARFAMNDAASPTVVRDTADGSALYVLMPMRV
jgi:DNA polymerase III subunit beta